MSAMNNPEDRGLHAKMLVEGVVDELARWFNATGMPDPKVAALGAAVHYMFEIAGERYGVDGVRFLERLVPDYVHHAITGEMPGEEAP